MCKPSAYCSTVINLILTKLSKVCSSRLCLRRHLLTDLLLSWSLRVMVIFTVGYVHKSIKNIHKLPIHAIWAQSMTSIIYGMPALIAGLLTIHLTNTYLTNHSTQCSNVPLLISPKLKAHTSRLLVWFSPLPCLLSSVEVITRPSSSDIAQSIARSYKESTRPFRRCSVHIFLLTRVGAPSHHHLHWYHNLLVRTATCHLIWWSTVHGKGWIFTAGQRVVAR